MKFTTSQLRAIEHDQGNLVLFAVAGSGKTTVLVERIKRLARTDEPQLVLTFSKKAAETLVNRVSGAVGANSFIGTFHSFCYHVMKRRKPEQYANKELLQSREAWMLVAWAEDALKGGSSSRTPSQLARIMTGLKTGGYHPDTWISNCDAIMAAFQGLTWFDIRAATSMQDRLEQSQRFTFDDMIVDCLYALDQDPGFGALLRGHFAHIMVDEFQDTDPCQGRILQHLALNNLCVVGDDNQSIYAFRGCTPVFIRSFEQYYGACTLISMEENFRSEAQILDCANALIRHNRDRTDITLKATGGSAGLVQATQVRDAPAEAMLIADLIQQYKADGCAYRDIAVLYRVNAQAGALEDELVERQIPFEEADSNGGFYSRTEIKTLINYLRIAHNDRDVTALRWVLNRPNRFLRSAWVSECSTGTPLSVRRILKGMGYMGGLRQQHAVSQLENVLHRASAEAAQGASPAIIAHTLWQGLDYDRYLREIAARSTRAKSVEEASDAAHRFLTQTLPRFSDLPQLLTHIDRVEAESRRRQSDRDAVRLTTVHRAKGLEFPIVILAGLNQDLFPHKEADTEEERRLAYVAVTRAMHTLHITTYGEPSSFFTELGLTPINHTNEQLSNQNRPDPGLGAPGGLSRVSQDPITEVTGL